MCSTVYSNVEYVCIECRPCSDRIFGMYKGQIVTRWTKEPVSKFVWTFCTKDNNNKTRVQLQRTSQPYRISLGSEGEITLLRQQISEGTTGGRRNLVKYNVLTT